MKKRIESLYAHPDNERIYHKTNVVADHELKESIRQEGLLEPIAITRDGMILSGHRRVRACSELGHREVECRVIRSKNHIITLISYNKHRTKTPSEILAEASYYQRELQKEVGRGRTATKKRDGKKLRTDDLTAEKIGISRGNLRWLKYVKSRRPDLIPRIGEDLTLEEAKRLCKTTDKKQNDFQDDLLRILKKHKPTYQEFSNNLRYYPPFIAETTGVSKDEVIEFVYHLDALSRLNERAILDVRKLDEIQNAEWMGTTRVGQLKQMLPTWDEIEDWILGATGVSDVEVHHISGQAKTKFSPLDYRIIRTLISRAPYKQGPGNESKVIVGFSTKKRGFRVLGLLRLHSDFAQVQDREDHIGWTKEVRAEKREFIANLFDCVPVGTFGSNALGGKFLALLATHPRITQHYKKPILGMTITSLFGLESSMYHGLERWGLRSIGETKGQQLISPLTRMKNKWSVWLAENFPEERATIRTTTGKVPVTAPKQQELNLLYQLLGIPRTKYQESYPRGLFFVERHQNAREWLRSPTKKNLPPIRSEIESGQWFDWWKVRATKRIGTRKETKQLDRSPLWLETMTPAVLRRSLSTYGIPQSLIDKVVS